MRGAKFARVLLTARVNYCGTAPGSRNVASGPPNPTVLLVAALLFADQPVHSLCRDLDLSTS